MRNAALLVLLAALTPCVYGANVPQPEAQPGSATPPAPLTPTIVKSGQPADVKAPALSPEQAAELGVLKSWLANYHTKPQPDKVAAAFADLARLGELNSGARGWPAAAVIAELLRAHPERTEEWCRAFDTFEEPDRHWFFTGVWFAATEQSKAAIASRAALAAEDARKLSYPWVSQTPQSILTRRIRGPQQIEMLLGAYGINGKTEFLGKLIEALDDPPKDDPKISEKGRQRLTRVIAAVQVALARACRSDESIKAFCTAQVAAQKQPIAGRIEELLKKSEGTDPIADAPAITGE